MDESQVIALLKTSTSAKEWNDNCAKIKKACGGYPTFWYPAIIASGLADQIMAEFGESATIRIR
jgi:hypothetical protein